MRDKVSSPTTEPLRVLMWVIAKTAEDPHCNAAGTNHTQT
jgi:hypothetical protein